MQVVPDTGRVRLDITRGIFLTESGWQHVPHFSLCSLSNFFPIPALAGHKYNPYQDLGQEVSYRHDA